MSATTPEQPDHKNSAVSAVVGLVMLGGALYLIWQGIKLFTL